MRVRQLLFDLGAVGARAKHRLGCRLARIEQPAGHALVLAHQLERGRIDIREAPRRRLLQVRELNGRGEPARRRSEFHALPVVAGGRERDVGAQRRFRSGCATRTCDS